MRRGKKIIAKIMALTIILPSITTSVNALTPKATPSIATSTIAGKDRYETAVKISEAGWKTGTTNAILINGDKGLVDALTATPYAALKDAPILVTQKNKLTATTKTRLTKMKVTYVDIIGGESVVSKSVENELKSMGITVKRIQGSDRYKTSVAVANEIKKLTSVNKIAVVNGAKGLPDAVSIAAPAANNKMPIILSDPKHGVNEAKNFISSNPISKSYVVGESSTVSNSVMNSLPGTKVRLGGNDRHDTNADVVKEFYPSTNIDNLYIAKSGYIRNNEELVDALAAGVLAAKNNVPMIIVGDFLANSQKTLLASKKFTKLTLIGNGIPAYVTNEIKNTQIQIESKVTSVNAIDFKTIEINGTNLDKLNSNSIAMTGKKIEKFTLNSPTKITVTFDKGFSASNSVKITSNLGKTTSHTFKYEVNITSLEALTTQVGIKGEQYIEFTVNKGQKKSIEELKALGWTVEFKASHNVFQNGTSASSTSKDGKLIEDLSKAPFGEGGSFTYDITLKKGTTIFKVEKINVDIINTESQYTGIASYKIQLPNEVKLNSSTLVLGEVATIVDLKALDRNNKEIYIGDVRGTNFIVKSSNTNVILVDKTGPNAKKLQTMSVGQSDITITNGLASKTFRISVTDEARTQNSISLSTSNLYLNNRVSEDVTLTIKDQYNDPFKDYRLELANQINGNTVVLNNSDGVNIANANITNRTTDKDGKIIIPITSQATGSGSTDINIRKNTTDTKNWATLKVNVGGGETITRRTLSPVSGTDTTIDIYNNNDNKVVLDYKEYNGNYLLDRVPTIYKIPASATIVEDNLYKVRSTKEDIAQIQQDGAGGQITVVGIKPGTTVVEVYQGKTKRASISITVKDSTPKITNINFKKIETITKSYTGANQYDLIPNLLDTKTSGNKIIVSGLTMQGTGEIVLLGKDLETISRPALFVDKNGDGVYDNSDLLLATIDIATNFGGVVADDGSGKLNIPAGVKKGEILVRVYEKHFVHTTNPIKTTTINVNNV